MYLGCWKVTDTGGDGHGAVVSRVGDVLVSDTGTFGPAPALALKRWMAVLELEGISGPARRRKDAWVKW